MRRWAAAAGVGGVLLTAANVPVARGEIAAPPGRPYLSREVTPDRLRILPPPPAADGPAARSDRGVFEATRRLRGRPRWRVATSDVDTDAFSHFACALGAKLSVRTAPALARLLDRADTSRVVDPVKRFYRTPRPYLGTSAPIRQPRTAPLAGNGDYPSGHAANGWMEALILAELAPDRATEILARGRAFGESRVVCGAHSLSAVEAGWMAGAAATAALHGAPAFRADLEVARSEMAAARATSPAPATAAHPDGLAGNSAVRLISVDGGETDAVHGRMAPTPWLAAMPYLRQVLAGFGVVWSRSRLMRLAPRASVPEHADINYHWHTRVRLHIPVATRPQVRFHCDGTSVHMAAGEAWIFDNWRRHHVENGADADRIHLVADTTGTAAFWRFACGEPPPRDRWRTMTWTPGADPPLLTEDDPRSPVMPAAEVQLLVDDLRAELAASPEIADAAARVARFGLLLESFVRDWRQLCALHGSGGRGRGEFLRLAEAVHANARPLADGMIMRTNGAAALLVLEKRVLQHLVADV